VFTRSLTSRHPMHRAPNQRSVQAHCPPVNSRTALPKHHPRGPEIGTAGTGYTRESGVAPGRVQALPHVVDALKAMLGLDRPTNNTETDK